MSDLQALADATRRGAGLFSLERGVISVTGEDRVRWLDGMISAEVASLSAWPGISGRYALLLSPKGRIVADLHVLHDDATLWLELEASAAPEDLARLRRYVISEDVGLADASSEFLRLALEGPGAPAVLERAGAGEALALATDAWLRARVGGTSIGVAAYGWSGEPAYQLFVPRGRGEPVREALRDAAPDVAWVEADAATLELLRIEAGVPRLGAELDEEVFPAEARLTERAVSFTKGCYTGQEIVARLATRGRVNHLLVGLAFDAAAPPEPGTPLVAEGRRIGEVTSACVSPRVGAIGLGYVRRPLDAPGTSLEAAGSPAQVVALPFVTPGSP